MRFIQIAVFILISFSVQAQKDTLATKTYEELSALMESFASPKTFKLISYYQQKANRENDLLEQFHAKTKFIEASVWNRKFDQAQDSLPDLKDFALQHSLKTELTKSLYLIGQAYFFQGIWGKSIDRYSEALKIAEESNDKKFQQKLLLQIGYIRSTIGDDKEALKLQMRSLGLLNDIDFDPEELEDALGLNHYYLSRTYIQRKQQDSAGTYIDLALKSVAKPKDSCLRKAFLRTKAEIAVLKKDFTSAEHNLKKAMTLCKPHQKIDSFIFYGEYGKLYLAKQEYKDAQHYLQEALDIYGVKEEEEGFMQDHYKLLAKAYKHTGDIEKSNFYLEKYINTSEEFMKIQDSVSSVFKLQEVKKFKAELKSIKEEKEQNQSNLNYVLLATSAIILFLLLALLRFYRMKKRNEIKFEALLKKINSADKMEEITVTKNEEFEEKSTTDVPEETKQQILSGLKKLEEREYFLQQECNSYNVAKKINTNTSYLSKVINSHFGKNFNSYINDLRINYAILRLKNDVVFRSYSIQSIAEEVGYKSADSFTKYFKLNTGLNPSFYIKEIKNIA
jgi:YesN/AraC family two-component response regulator